MLNIAKTVATAALISMPVGAFAQDVLLSVTVKGETLTFERSALEALPVAQFTTTTIWTEGEQTFTGVTLHDLLSELGVEDGVVKATAINDYAIEIPYADITEDAPVIAYLRNGEEMSVRDKGPLWVVYPYDSAPEFRNEVAYSRSIWQLDRIDIQE